MGTKVKLRGKSLTQDEIEYIRQHCAIETDEQIAKALGRRAKSVANCRKKFGVYKAGHGKMEKLIDINGKTNLVLGSRLNEKEKGEFFKAELMNTLYYQNIKEQFTKDEIEFYLEEWAALCIQFQDIVGTEKRQIDELIKASIMDNRILRNLKVVEDTIEEGIKEAEAIRGKFNLDDNVEASERYNDVMQLIDYMSSESKTMSRDHYQFVDIKNKLLGELNARRKDRIDHIHKTGTTFLGLVEAFQNANVRQIQGKQAELIRLSKKAKEKSWRQKNMFPDGKKDPILLDEHTIFDDSDQNKEENGEPSTKSRED